MTAPHVTKPYHLSNHFKRDDRPDRHDRIRTDDGRWHFISRTVFNAAAGTVLNLMEYQEAPVPSIVDGPRPGTVELRFGEVVSVVVVTCEAA